MVTKNAKCIYLEYHSVGPFVGIGTPASECVPQTPPEPKEEGTHSPAVGGGGVLIQTTGEKA